jgi:hypothetical protein
MIVPKNVESNKPGVVGHIQPGENMHKIRKHVCKVRRSRWMKYRSFCADDVQFWGDFPEEQIMCTTKNESPTQRAQVGVALRLELPKSRAGTNRVVECYLRTTPDRGKGDLGKTNVEQFTNKRDFEESYLGAGIFVSFNCGRGTLGQECFLAETCSVSRDDNDKLSRVWLQVWPRSANAGRGACHVQQTSQQKSV